MRPRLVLTIALILALGTPAYAQAPRSGGELVFVVGSESPISMRIVVVLPAPFGPRIPKISPGQTSRSRWSTATISP